MTFILVSVFERDIHAVKYHSYEEAHAAMLQALKEEVSNYLDEKADASLAEILKRKRYDGVHFGFDALSAWSEMDENCNCDWKIYSLANYAYFCPALEFAHE